MTVSGRRRRVVTERLRPRWAVAAATVVVFAVGFDAPVLSQVAVHGESAPSDPGAHHQFQMLRSPRAIVGYLPGSLDRAHHLLRRLENLGEYFRRWSKDQPVPLAAYVVDRSQWRDLELPGLYGLPLRTGPSSVFVPGAGDEEMVRMWRSALGLERLPALPGVPVTGTAEQAAALALSDVLTQFEVSRNFAVQMGLSGSEGWLQEVAAHVAALTVARRSEPQRQAEFHDLFLRLRERMGGPQRHATNQFSHDLQHGGEEQVKAWLWHQGVYFAAAEIIVGKDGGRSVAKLLSMARAGRYGRPALEERYPELREWHQRWFESGVGADADGERARAEAGAP